MSLMLKLLVEVHPLDSFGVTRLDFIHPETRALVKRMLVPDGQAGDFSLVVATPQEERDNKQQVREQRKVMRTSRKQERRVAEDIGGRTQPASGAMPHAKGDVRKLGRLRVEAKTTWAGSYRLTEEVLDKIAAHASYGEIPVVVVDFVDKKTNKVKRSVAVVPYEDWVKEVNGGTDIDQ